MVTADIGSTDIDMWGDSLTQGAGAPGADRYYWLRRYFRGRVVRQHGIGGIATKHVAAWQGGAPTKVTVTGNVLNTTTAVTITASTPVSLGVTAADTTDRYISGFCDGQSVMYKRTGATNALSMTSTNGTSPTITAGSEFIPDDGINARQSIQSICAGTNDRGVTSQSDVAADLAAMVAFVEAPRRVLVHGVHCARSEPTGSGATRTWVDQVNAARLALYGGGAATTGFNGALIYPGLRETAFISWEPPTAAEMAAVGFTPDAQDNTDIGNGIWPEDLVYATDGLGLHLVSQGYRIIANREIATIVAQSW